jgi:hypothetical protein
MPGTPLLMTFPVTATSHLLAEYRTRGGYGAPQRASSATAAPPSRWAASGP